MGRKASNTGKPDSQCSFAGAARGRAQGQVARLFPALLSSSTLDAGSYVVKGKMGNFTNEGDMIGLSDLVKIRADQAGGYRALGRILDVDHVYLWRLANDEKKCPSDEVLDKLGIERIITYREKGVIEWLKWMVVGKEMRALDRYRAACHLAWRWNGQIHGSSETADWIRQVGEGQRGMDIEQFRERLKDFQKATK